MDHGFLVFFPPFLEVGCSVLTSYITGSYLRRAPWSVYPVSYSGTKGTDTSRDCHPGNDGARIELWLWVAASDENKEQCVWKWLCQPTTSVTNPRPQEQSHLGSKNRRVLFCGLTGELYYASIHRGSYRDSFDETLLHPGHPCWRLARLPPRTKGRFSPREWPSAMWSLQRGQWPFDSLNIIIHYIKKL